MKEIDNNEEQKTQKRILGFQIKTFYVTLIGLVFTAFILWLTWRMYFLDNNNKKEEGGISQDTTQLPSTLKDSTVYPFKKSDSIHSQENPIKKPNNDINKKSQKDTPLDPEKEEIKKGVKEKFKTLQRIL